jgi:hypothetical protein
MLGTFKPWIKVILGINSSAAIFVNLLLTFMCICVGECSTFGGLSASCIGNMTTNYCLDHGANACGCYSSWFMYPSLLVVMD